MSAKSMEGGPRHSTVLTRLPPALLAALGVAFMTGMDALAKNSQQVMGPIQITFLRYVAGSIVSLALCLWLRPPWPSRASWIANSKRAILVGLTTLFIFFALSQLPLADAIALSFLSPLFIALFGALLLGEVLNRRLQMALALGCAGMAVMTLEAWLRREAGAVGYGPFALLGAAAALASAASYGLSTILLRQRAQTDPILTIIVILHVVPVAVLAIPALLTWQDVPSRLWGQIAAIGVLGSIGHILISLGFARAAASRLAPIEYTALIWAGLIGWLAFGTLPSGLTVAGALLIVGGAWLSFRQRGSGDG